MRRRADEKTRRRDEEMKRRRNEAKKRSLINLKYNKTNLTKFNI